MTLYDIIIGGGVWWPSPQRPFHGHDIALPTGTLVKVRTGGVNSSSFVGGHIEEGAWVLDGGSHAGSYPSADAAVKAVHGGTSLNAWLYVVIMHEGAWKGADDIRRTSRTELDPHEVWRLKGIIEKIRRHAQAKGAEERRVLLVAAQNAAKTDS